MKKLIFFCALFFMLNMHGTDLSVAIMNSKPEQVKTALLHKKLSPSEKEKYLDLADKIVDFRKTLIVLITGITTSAGLYFAIKSVFIPRPIDRIDCMIQSVSVTVLAVVLLLTHRWACEDLAKEYCDALTIKELLYDA